MANYRIGDIIRLTRKSIGMSQEELAYQAGVATETISRIESGKHKVTQATYQKVMEPLNRFQNRSYAVCTSDDLGIIEEKRLLEDAEMKFDYEKAAIYIDDIKQSVENNAVNRQYIMRAETWNAYYTKKIDAKTMVERLEEALALTVDNYQQYTDYKNYQEDGYPFTEQEIIILMNIAGAYDEYDLPEKTIEISNMLLDCLNSGYIGGEDVSNLKIVIKRNLTFALQGMGKYEEALDVLQEVLEQSIKQVYGIMISFALYDITWDMEHINKMESKQRYDLEEIRQKKRQAYYIAAARNDEYIKKIVEDSYKRLFHEEIAP